MSASKLFVVGLFVSVAAVSHAQVLDKPTLTGVWVCKEIKNDEALKDKRELEGMKQLAAVLQSAKFKFQSNGRFAFEFKDNTSEFARGMTSMVNNQPWSIEATKSVIHVGEPRAKLMQIQWMAQQGLVYFIMSDTPLLLRMEKE